MMKIIGSAVFFISLTAVGAAKAAEVRKRLSSISSALIILSICKSELSTSRAPMNIISERIASSKDRLSALFGSKLKANTMRLGEMDLSSLWSEAAMDILSSLPDDCMTEFCAFGAFIGRYEVESQLEAIDRCISRISTAAEEYRPKSVLEAKMYIGLYSGFGLIVAILLI